MFYDSSVHRGAWSFLRQALRASEPFVLLTGDFGAGKTLLALKLVNALEQRQLGPCVYLSTPAQGYIEVLRRSYRALGLGEPDDDVDPDRLLERIYAYFENERPAQRLYIVLEDPQDLDPETLHRIRLLPNYNVEGRFPVCLIMFAHTSFPQMLRDARWQALDQRLKLRYHIPRLERSETREYIYFRLLKAQGDQQDPFAPYFEEDAIDLVYDLTNGIPREINNLCGMCLTLGGSRRIVALKTPLVREAAQMLGWSLESDNEAAATTAKARSNAKAKPAQKTAGTGQADTAPQGQAPPAQATTRSEPASGSGAGAPEAAGTPADAPGPGDRQPVYPPGPNPAWGGPPYAGQAHPAGYGPGGYGPGGYGPGGYGPGGAYGPPGAGVGGASDGQGHQGGLGGPPEQGKTQNVFKQYAWWFAVGGLMVLIVAVAISRNLNLLE